MNNFHKPSGCSPTKVTSTKPSGILAFQAPVFNVYFFALCSVAHVVRLALNSVSPTVSTFLFLFEYGLLSSFIKVEVQDSWINVADRYRDDIMQLFKGCVDTLPCQEETSSGIPQQVSSVSTTTTFPIDSDSDSDSDDEEISMSLAELTAELKKKK